MVKIRKILVPIDFSKESLSAVEAATSFAARFDAELLLVHVVEFPVYPTVATGAGAVTLPTLQSELRENAARHLEEVQKSAIPEGVRSRTLLREGASAWGEIVAAAEEEAADLIAIATHGHSGFKHLLLGSTAERVVRKAGCPVLTVRCGEAA